MGGPEPGLSSSLEDFADKRVEALTRGRGAEKGAGKLGKVMGKVRRAMSVQVVRSNALCLLERPAFHNSKKKMY